MQTDQIVKLTREAIGAVLGERHRTQAGVYAGKDRRNRARWPFPGTVQIWPCGGDGRQNWYGTLRDLSEDGLGMCCDDPFIPGTRVEIALHVPEASFCGQAIIRYCQPTGRDYLVGVQFQFPA